jgi:hypothetical protein
MMKQLIALAVTAITLAATVLVAQAQTFAECGRTDYFNTAVGQCVTRYGGHQQGGGGR